MTHPTNPDGEVTVTDQKTQMREGFEAQRNAGMNVDWFTWQIAWHDALFTVHDIAGDALLSATQPAAVDREAVNDAQCDLACEEWANSFVNIRDEPVVLSQSRQHDFKQGFDAARKLLAAPLDSEVVNK